LRATRFQGTQTKRILDWVMALFLLGVPAAFLHANMKSQGDLNVLDRTVLAISAPVQSAVSWVIEGIGGIWNGYVWLVDVEDENDELRRENGRLRRELAEAQRLAAEVPRLEEAAALRERVPADAIGARVVATGINPYFRISRVTLDRGDREVKGGMAVLSAQGVVGRISRVYGDYADVLLAVDPQSSIDVFVPRTGSRGVLKGLGGDNGYACKIDYLLRTDEVKEGDPIRTSGLGGVFPRDELVGRVRSVKKSEYGLYQEVEVEPAVDFARLLHVVVVLAPPPPADPSATSKKSPEPAFGMRPYK
jgi:rod shape-determining protein MreC